MYVRTSYTIYLRHCTSNTCHLIGVMAVTMNVQFAWTCPLSAPCNALPPTGTAIITEQHAAMWTDGRYFLQASQQMDTNWTLMKMGKTAGATTPPIYMCVCMHIYTHTVHTYIYTYTLYTVYLMPPPTSINNHHPVLRDTVLRRLQGWLSYHSNGKWNDHWDVLVFGPIGYWCADLILIYSAADDEVGNAFISSGLLLFMSMKSWSDSIRYLK